MKFIVLCHTSEVNASHLKQSEWLLKCTVIRQGTICLEQPCWVLFSGVWSCFTLGLTWEKSSYITTKKTTVIYSNQYNLNVCLSVNINPISSPALGFILNAGCWDCERNTLTLWEICINTFFAES